MLGRIGVSRIACDDNKTFYDNNNNGVESQSKNYRGVQMDNNSLSNKVKLSISHRIHTKIMYGKVREDMREILRTICNYKNVEIILGAVCVSIIPKISVSEFVGYLKGKSALMIHDKNPKFANKWNREFVERGYYVTTIGNINEENNQKIYCQIYCRTGRRN